MARFVATPGDDAKRHFGLGFDASAPPAPEFGAAAGDAPWLMVPLDDDAFFCLQDGAGLTLQSAAHSTALILMDEGPGTSAMNSQLRNVKIRGLQQGNGVIEARRGDSVVARLRYTVFDRVQYSVRFFTVRDRGQRHWSRRALSDAKGMIELANKLFEPQANVSFTFDGPWLDSVDAQLPDVLPDVGRMQPAGSPLYEVYKGSQVLSGPLAASASPDWVVWTAIFKPAVKDKRVYNVFFVWKTDNWNTPAATLGNCAFIQDGIARPEHVFAHEAGHFALGSQWNGRPDGHSSGPQDLMRQTRRDDFIRIPMAQAFAMQERAKFLNALATP